MLMPKAPSPTPSSPSPPTLSVLTFNILAPPYKRLRNSQREAAYPHLWTQRLDNLTALLLGIQPAPDVICLQEVWFNSALIAHLERALGSHYHIFYAQRPEPKEDGLATLVRKANPHAQHPLFEGAARHVASFTLAKSDRVGLAVSVPLLNGAELLLVNTHLMFPHCAISHCLRAEQAAHLVDFVADYAARRDGTGRMHTLLMGDFNGDAEGKACKKLTQAGFINCYEAINGTRSRPATHFNHRQEQVFVDHVFLSGEAGVRKRRRRSTLSFATGEYREEQGESRRMRRTASGQRAVSPSPVGVRDVDRFGQQEGEGQTLRFRPIASKVYPEKFRGEVWPKEFEMSDHRPVGIIFEYDTK